MNEKVIYWQDLSDYDMETAVAMLETKRYLYVGFMCHQSIEKLLKAYMCAQSIQPLPKIHNLIRLAEQSELFERMNDKQRKTLFLLNPLNIESRYPTYKQTLLQQLNEGKCIEIIQDTRELVSWIKELL